MFGDPIFGGGTLGKTPRCSKAKPKPPSRPPHLASWMRHGELGEIVPELDVSLETSKLSKTTLRHYRWLKHWNCWDIWEMNGCRIVVTSSITMSLCRLLGADRQMMLWLTWWCCTHGGFRIIVLQPLTKRTFQVKVKYRFTFTSPSPQQVLPTFFFDLLWILHNLWSRAMNSSVIGKCCPGMEHLRYLVHALRMMWQASRSWFFMAMVVCMNFLGVKKYAKWHVNYKHPFTK